MSYIFRREDNGELVEVDFATMIQQDALGCITLPCGVTARRCVYLEQAGEQESVVRSQESADTKHHAPTPPILSDSLGFCQHQFQDFERDRVKNGFSGIEFVRDARVPQFFQVKCSSPDEWRRYVKHRGMYDKNSRNGGGAGLSAEQLAKAEQQVRMELEAREAAAEKILANFSG